MPDESKDLFLESHEVTAADVPFKRSPEFRSYWTNALQYMGTQFDIRLIFCEASPDEHGATVVQQTCSVAMSYEHAKALVIVLNKNIRDREKRFGPLYLVERTQSAEKPETDVKKPE